MVAVGAGQVRAPVDALTRHVPLALRTEPQYVHGQRRERPRRQPDRLQSRRGQPRQDRKSTRLNSSHANISYAVFCLKKKNTTKRHWSRVSMCGSTNKTSGTTPSDAPHNTTITIPTPSN